MSAVETKVITTVRTGDDVYGELVDTYGRPFKVPNYTLKEILEAIPPRCFERSPLRGFLYIVQDLTLIGLTFYLTNTYVTPEYVPSWQARYALWTLYTILQGFFGTGIWVIAHECNHQAFSKYRTLNDVTGWILHSAVLVPYFSWKIVHKQHHSVHNNLAKDLQFVPRDRESYAKEMGKDSHSNWEFTEDTPLYSALQLLGQQLWGWPYYLLTNISGSESYKKRSDGRGVGKHNGWGGGVNHFDPNSPLFSEGDRHLILLSDLGIAITLATVSYIGYRYGWINILVWYWIPYLWVNHWLG
jgi:omega-6 fatty acid desaturase / acyl-lipid omega-6 desaturase (Delta-12 desaturase)